jgi:hypothetical protein
LLFCFREMVVDILYSSSFLVFALNLYVTQKKIQSGSATQKTICVESLAVRRMLSSWLRFPCYGKWGTRQSLYSHPKVTFISLKKVWIAFQAIY